VDIALENPEIQKNFFATWCLFAILLKIQSIMNCKIENIRTGRKYGGLNREILLTLVLLLGAALLFGGFLFLRFAEQKFLDQHLALLLEVSRSTAMDQVRDGNIRPVQFRLSRLQRDFGAEAWWLYDARLRLVQGYAIEDVPQVSTIRLRRLLLQREEALDVDWNPLPLFSGNRDGSARVIVPLSVQPPARGLLVVQYSLAPLREQISRARRWVFLYAFGYGLVLAAVGYLLMRRNVIQPVKNLLAATEKVTMGQLDTVLATEGPLEIARLAGSFNQMTRALEQSRRQTEATIQSLKRANQELEQTRDELVRSEKLATVGHLAAGMAHEIGNPLGALMGYLALLRQELPAGESAEMADLAVREAERIDRLVRDLLDYAAPGHSDPAPFDPWGAVLETIELLRLQGTLKNMQLTYAENLVLPPVSMDRRKLEQVLVNLLINARDACNGQGIIRLEGDVVADRVILRVADNGCGMSADIQNQLFEPFFTTKAPGKGRGLGLAVCQRVIAEAGGEIRVESVEGEGSCFSLLLPPAGDVDG